MGRPVMQWQILAKDPEAASDFYAKLFGWTIDANNPLGYRRADTGTRQGISGGFWPAGPEGHALVQLFVEVDDVKRYAARVAELGGSLIIPPQVLPDGDELAIVRDVEGLSFGLMKTAKR